MDRLPIEPSIEAGNSFMFSLKARLRDIAKALNPIAAVFDYIVPRRDSTASGYTGLTIDATAPSNNAFINLIKGGSGKEVAIAAYSGDTAHPRWILRLGNATAETGGNAGSDLQIDRFSDAGALIDSTVLIARSSGAMLRSTQPGFFASGSSSATSLTNITWASVAFNTGGNFNNTNGRFTAPHAGVYFFRYNVLGAPGLAGEVRIAMLRNGISVSGTQVIANKAAGQLVTATCQMHIAMAAGDYVNVHNMASPEALYGASSDPAWSSFSGHLVG